MSAETPARPTAPDTPPAVRHVTLALTFAPGVAAATWKTIKWPSPSASEICREELTNWAHVHVRAHQAVPAARQPQPVTRPNVVGATALQRVWLKKFLWWDLYFDEVAKQFKANVPPLSLQIGGLTTAITPPLSAALDTFFIG